MLPRSPILDIDIKTGLKGKKLSRRKLISASARAGISAIAFVLIGCGNDNNSKLPSTKIDRKDSAPSSVMDEYSAESDMASVTPRGGGVLRLHSNLGSLDNFDIHRSLFPITQRFSALQQNRLLRPANVSNGTLDGDLANLPEIPDKQTYVFQMKSGVRWWNQEPTYGREFTANDAKSNIQRQIAAVDVNGNPDPAFLRQKIYQETERVDVIDDATLVVRTRQPISTYLTDAFSGPWAFMQAPEMWRDFGGRLYEEPLNFVNYSGTGPFTISHFLPMNRIVLSRNPIYFRENAPLFNGIEFLHLPGPVEQESAFREGQIDLLTPADPNVLDPLLEEFDGLNVSEHALAFPLQMFLCLRDIDSNPLRDKRLAQAINIALNRRELLDHVYGAYARLSGPVPWFSAGWGLSEDILRELEGYKFGLGREHLEKIEMLVSATGFNDSFSVVITDVLEKNHPGLGLLIQERLSSVFPFDIHIEYSDVQHIFNGLREGTVQAAIGWGGSATHFDPTSDLLQSVHSLGMHNIGGYKNLAVDSALERMQEEFNTEKRRFIYQELVESHLLDDPSWQLNVGHGMSRSLYRSDIVLPRFDFGWDGHRFEQAWHRGAED